jgi:hypothetical protein
MENIAQIIAGLQKRSCDIFYDFHEFGDVDEHDRVIDTDEGGSPGCFQADIEQLCVAAERAEEILRMLDRRLDIARELGYDLSAISEITPGPWTVSSHRDTEGAYIIKEALREQQFWLYEGYDISEEEGCRREQMVSSRDAANIRLIALAPLLFEIFRDLLSYPEKEKAPVEEVMK